MIFFTVGTQLPFDRLTQALDVWAADNPDHKIIGQISDPGPEGYKPRHFAWTEHFDPASFQARFETATHIVAHAGMGTIISALSAGKPLLIMPRRAELGEQRNDHQLATARRFGEKPGIRVVEEAGEVASCMDELLALGVTAAATGRFADPALIAALRAELMG
ncbi:MAG: glycosyltransferase [Pseudomonadota bacterium]